MKYYITGTRRGLGKALEEKYGNCESLDECDIFINCKHDKFSQVEALYNAVEKGKKTINIGSYASDWVYMPWTEIYPYAIEKKALRDANSQLFDHGHNVTCINFGFLNTESQSDKDVAKMEISYALDIIDWVIQQPHRVKELTIVPEDKK